MTKNILLSGVGGQGTILASKVLSHGLLSAGYDVKMSEIHGMSQRGGAVGTHIRYGQKVYSSVVEKGQADILISFEQMEALRWMPYMKSDGKAIINNEVIYPQSVQSGKLKYSEQILPEIESKIETYVINAKQEATKLDNPRGTNILLVGACAKLLGLLDIDWMQVIASNVKPQFVESNQKVFNRGVQLAS